MIISILILATSLCFSVSLLQLSLFRLFLLRRSFCASVQLLSLMSSHESPLGKLYSQINGSLANQLVGKDSFLHSLRLRSPSLHFTRLRSPYLLFTLSDWAPERVTHSFISTSITLHSLHSFRLGTWKSYTLTSTSVIFLSFHSTSVTFPSFHSFRLGTWTRFTLISTSVTLHSFQALS